MADQDKFKQFIDELQKAVGQGNLPRDILDFARSMLIVGGDMINSQAIIGDNNVVNYYQQPTIPVEGIVERDEQVLVVEALNAYRREQRTAKDRVSESPYPGLLAYRLQDASHFFGRKQAVAELMAELERKQVIWLHGRSGTGKSSLIQAGLLPALLEKDAFPISVRSLDDSPSLALKKALLKRRWSDDLKLSAESLLQFLSRVDEALKGRQIYIFFDQFEEFISRLPETKQDEFAHELADCVADTSLPVHFIFSLRSDYFGETAILRERLQAGVGREYPVRPLKMEEARQVIIGPLEKFGVTYQEGLVDAILHHLGTAEVYSPQLQLVCEKLFHTLTEDSRQITVNHYQQLGETKGIINDYLKQVLHDQQVIPASQFKAATYILSTLVTHDGKRDMKQASDWYEDERLRLMTFGWRVDQGNLPIPDSVLAMQSINPITVVNFIEQVKKHVSAQGEDLRQIVDDMLNGYVRKTQSSFVDDVVRSLRDARLLHEIQSDDGELSYELIHDYLIAEVMGWLDEDEQNARQLRNKLNQKQLDFIQYKLFLEPKELEIISSQLGNPKLLLQESDKRLLLLSAATHGNGRQWLTFSGSNGLDWLREVYRDESFPENVRQGVAALLGEVSDQETFDKLLEKIEYADQTAKKRDWLDLLAHYLNRSIIDLRIPWSVKWAVFWRQAQLMVREGADERKRMSRVAMIAAPICSVISSLVDPNFGSITYFFTMVILAALSSFMAFIFSQILTSLIFITERWSIVWRVLIHIIAGSAIGILLFLFVAAQPQLWFIGGIIGLALAMFGRGRGFWKGWKFGVLVIGFVILIFSLTLSVLQKILMLEIGYAISASLFSGVYLFFIQKEKKKKDFQTN